MSLLLADDATLHDLNKTYRGKDRPTDVLSFPDDDPDGLGLGDIAISMDRAVEQAPRFSATFEQEVARLVVHGLLHLLGYDHHSPADGRRMKAKERVYLSEVEKGSIAPAAAARGVRASAPRGAARRPKIRSSC